MRYLVKLLAVAWLAVCSIALGHAARKVALVIGCNHYADTPLVASVLDAEQMSAVLKDAGFIVWTMTDKAVDANGEVHPETYYPTKSNIVRQCGLWAAKDSLGKGDTILLYFSGHGLWKEGVDYLAPLDYGELKPENLVSLIALYETLRGTGAENIVVITDTNRTLQGEYGSLTRTGDDVGKDETLTRMQLPAEGQRYAFLRSCMLGEHAYEDEGKGGYFTQALVAGLKGEADGIDDSPRDGVVTVQKLFAYVRKVVRQHSRDNRRLQTPQFICKGKIAEGIVLREGPVK